jgi:hypothetical protein
MTAWTIILEGGPRAGDRIATAALLPFMVFTTGHTDGTTTDTYYAPVSSNATTLTATYEPVDGPDAAIASIWDQGMRHVLDWIGKRDYAEVMGMDNPYRKAAP